MALRTQVRMLKTMRDILLGDGTLALGHGAEQKPDYVETESSVPLPRATPESQGIPSDLLQSFYRDMTVKQNVNPHALLVMRHGNVVAEGYFEPFRPEVWHITHSLCKSFTGTAVGIAIGEGLLRLSDRVVDIFPEYVTILTSRRMKLISVRHLLTMSSGITFNEITEAVEREWVRGILSSNVQFEPGSKFVYNSMNSYLLAAIVHRVTGQGVMEYLRPRLLQPLGFGPIAWEKSAEGIEKGGWGMYVTVEDMAKLGQLYLQKGRWETPDGPKQILPEGWVRQATRTQIKGENGDEYGYHFWTDGDAGTYRMNGMFGQYVMMIPAESLLIAMTSGNPCIFTDNAYALMRQYFYGRSFGGPLPEDPVALGALRRTLAALRCGHEAQEAGRRLKRVPARTRKERWTMIRTEKQGGIPPEALGFCGTTWAMPQNRGGLLPIIMQVMGNNFSTGVKALRLEQVGDILALYWEEEKGTLFVPIGFDRSVEHTLILGEESYLISSRGEIRPDEDGNPVLKIQVYFLEHSSSRSLKLSIIDGKLHLRMDELPAFMVAVETVLQQNATTGQAAGESLPEKLLGNAWLRHRVDQLCTPFIQGKPVETQQ